MKNLGIESLSSRHIQKAEINVVKDLVVLHTDKGPLYLTWEGDCCAHCYLAHVSGAENLIDAVITEVYNSEWKVTGGSKDNCDVTESMGTNIKTTKGYVTFESRLDHNGYYGGMILVSDDEPMDQYHSPRYGQDDQDDRLPSLSELKDF